MKQEVKTITQGPNILEFNIKDISNIFFTSDLHFNHNNIIKYCNRPYNNVEEMNSSLIDNINSELSKVNNPILINCGDVIFGKISMYEELMNNIHADKIYNIIGNHDLINVIGKRKMVPYNDNEKIFWSTELIIILHAENNKKETVFTVSHYPHCNGQFMGSFNIHGHLHTPKNLEKYEGTDINIAKKLKETELTYDVGVDGNDYKPVKLIDILTGNLINYQIKSIDHDKWKSILGIN